MVITHKVEVLICGTNWPEGVNGVIQAFSTSSEKFGVLTKPGVFEVEQVNLADAEHPIGYKVRFVRLYDLADKTKNLSMASGTQWQADVIDFTKFVINKQIDDENLTGKPQLIFRVDNEQFEWNP